MHEFTQHSGPISALAVHPTEFLMASASVDRTLRLWDLERFEQVCCTPPESGQIRKVVFSEDGGALLSGAEESLKVWGWEPVRCFEQGDVRWSRLADMSIAPGQKLLAGSVREAMVAVWSADLQAMKPFSSSAEPSEPIPRMPLSPPRAAVQSPAVPQRGHSAEPARGVDVDGRAPAGAAAIPKPAEDAAVQNARNAIAECRAQLAAARAASQCSDAAPSTTPPGAKPPPPPASSATPSPGPPKAGRAAAASTRTESESRGSALGPGEDMSKSGNHASIGTSMTDTLVPAPSNQSASTEQLSGRGPQQQHQQQQLANRLRALRVLHSFWTSGEVKKVSQTNAGCSAFWIHLPLPRP